MNENEAQSQVQQPLAAEMYADLKKATKFRERLIFILLGVIAVLVIALAGTNIYHIYQWSQFDTVVVDTGEGSGNANYIGGENTGGIYNGTGSGQTPEENVQQEVQWDAN